MDAATPRKVESPGGLPAGVEQAETVSGCPAAEAAPPVAAEASPEPPAGAGIRNPRRVRVRDADLQVDAEFASVLPPPSAEQLQALRHSLREQRGCTNFILLWAGRNVILDGHNRVRLSRELLAEMDREEAADKDLWLWLGEIELPDRAAALDWIRKHQLARRDLSPLAASCVRGEAYNARKGTRGGDRTSAGANRQAVGLLDVAEQVAAGFGVSCRTIERDGSLAEAVGRIAAHCARVKAEDGTKARQALLSPEYRLTRRHIARIDGMEPEQQHKAIAHLIANKKLPPVEQEGEGKVLLPRNAGDLVGAVIRLLGIRKAETFLKSFATALEEARSEAAAVDERRDRLRRRGGGRKKAA
jgi:hypothetical protein